MRTELRPLALEFPSGQGFAWGKERDSHSASAARLDLRPVTMVLYQRGLFPTHFLMWWITMNWINYKKNCKTRSWNQRWHEIGSWLQLSGTSTRRNLGSTLSDTSNASSPCCLPPPSLCCSAYQACSPLSQWPWLPSVPCPLQLSWCYTLFWRRLKVACTSSTTSLPWRSQPRGKKPSGYFLGFFFNESFPPCFKPRVLLMNLSE